MVEFETLDRFILEKMSETKLPGLSITAVKDGAVVYSRGYGFRDIEKAKPATPETLFCIGSVTKSFTCIAIMQLQERGLLSVDDEVAKHLPLSLRAKGEPVRIWHLMSHSSGIPALAYAEAVIRHTMKSADTWLPLVNWEDMYTFMDEAEGWAHCRPGERWFYLNEGFRLLGAIVEKVSGEGYENYVKRHILEPLGMTRSFFERGLVESDPEAATPYIVTRDGERIASTYPYGIVSSDGGLVSSVADMAKYITMYLNGGCSQSIRVLSEDSLREMLKPRVKTPDEPWVTKHARHYGYGLGSVEDAWGNTVINHGGSVTTATAQIAFIPERGVGVMVLANGTGYPLGYIADYALALINGKDPEELPTIRFERALKEVEGVYETYKGTMRGKVQKMGSLLSLETGDKYRDVTVPLIPLEWLGDVKRFEGLSADRKQLAEFYRVGGEQYLIYERYKMKRIGKI
jgi:CubicO group peptidase (beta-lactamase class C family)